MRLHSLIVILLLAVLIQVKLYTQTGIILGESGTMLKTNNGGANWAQKPTGTTLGLWNSYFINNQTGWVAGGSESGGQGVLLFTTDAGETWSNQPTGITNRWYTGVYFVNPRTGYICGEHGTLLKTTNAGGLWNLMNSGLTNTLIETVNFIDSVKGWLTGWGGTIFRTTDGAVTWSVEKSGTMNNLYTALFINNMTGYISGTGGIVLNTTDQGFTWHPCPIGVTGTNQEIFSIYFRGNNGWIAGNQGVLRYTTNAGNSWIAGSISTTTRLESVNFIDSLTGWVVGGYFGSVIFKSTNGGANWVQQSAPTTQHLYSVNFSDFITGIEPVNGSSIPEVFQLFQNYPNPFNPSTRIRFDISQNELHYSHVQLALYDINGREIALLVNKALSPGSYEVNWDASAVSSGTYFATLRTEGFVKSIKLELMK